MKEVREAIVTIMESTTLADLAERARELQQEPLTPSDFMI